MKKHYLRIKDISIWFAIVLILFVVNYIFKFSLNVNPRTLYRDDLAIYSQFKEGNLFDAVFLTAANKIRPVAYVIIYTAFQIVGTEFDRLDGIILFWNLTVAVGVTAVAYRLMEERISIWIKTGLSLAVGVLYSISRFSYYVWTEVFGLMESTALLLALFILMLQVRYIFDKGEQNLYIADLLYIVVIFTHERYMLLAGVILISIFLKHGMKKPLKFIVPIMIALAFVGIRILIFGNRFVDGTGGTSILDTFSLKDAIINILCQILYIFGLNAGPAYLNGISYDGIAFSIRMLIALQIIFLFFCLCSYLVMIVKKHDMAEIKKSLVYLVFIFCCIVSSSVTIRVEMRWIYVSYTAFLIYMAKVIAYFMQYQKFLIIGFFYLATGFVTEDYYQSYYKNIYYWGDRLLASSLYKETLVKYGSDFFNRDVYIVGNSMIWTEETWSAFYSQFFEEDVRFPNVIYTEHIQALLEHLPHDIEPIILLEDLNDCKYIDISEVIYAGR